MSLDFLFLTSDTSPKLLKYCLSLASSVAQLRPPTKTVVLPSEAAGAGLYTSGGGGGSSGSGGGGGVCWCW